MPSPTSALPARLGVEAAARALGRAGIVNHIQEARWLADAAGDETELRGLVARRIAGEPLQYLTGLAGFRYLELEVGPGVLIPRPETELVARRALELLPRGGTVVDIGTGSGAIALAIATERPDVEVHATDVSDAALSYAERNRARLGAKVDLHRGDLYEALPSNLERRIDVIVANPPYVGEDERDALPVDVRDHEPEVALYAGASGLEVLQRLVADARRWLRPGGRLVVEIGATQGAEARRMFEAAGLSEVAIHPDLTGRDRIAEGRS